MFKTFKDIKSILYPVFPIRSRDWYTQDGVLFLEDKVLDDRNMPGNTLGIRRIQCGRTDLVRLKRAYTDLFSMLKSGKSTFIDSNGIPFIYKKTITSPLKYHRINKLEYKDDHSILWLDGINHPMSIPRPPYGDARYARVLYYKGFPWVLYDFATEKGKDSYKRV